MTKTRIIIYFIVIPLVAFIVAGGVFIAVKQEKTGNITDTTILPSVENTADPSIGTSGTDSPSVPDIKTDGTEEHKNDPHGTVLVDVTATDEKQKEKAEPSIEGEVVIIPGVKGD